MSRPSGWPNGRICSAGSKRPAGRPRAPTGSGAGVRPAVVPGTGGGVRPVARSRRPPATVTAVTRAGGGVRGGVTHGSSDRVGAYPAENPVSPLSQDARSAHRHRNLSHPERLQRRWAECPAVIDCNRRTCLGQENKLVNLITSSAAEGLGVDAAQFTILAVVARIVFLCFVGRPLRPPPPRSTRARVCAATAGVAGAVAGGWLAYGPGWLPFGGVPGRGVRGGAACERLAERWGDRAEPESVSPRGES